MLTMGSLFDGIGGFPLAAVRNGIMPVWASKIEPFPIEVTKIRFPEMNHVGDITKLNGAELPPVDVICGGSPCQDLSVASGTRLGLAGARSGLFMEQVRIVKEMRKADERRNTPAYLVRPRYMVWENVPGAFSSGTPKGEDFRIVLEEIVRIKDDTCSVPRPDSGRWESAGGILLGDQFSLAWRVLDAQFWPGTPQRRRRIYLVADFGGRTAPEILFKQDSLFGNPAPGRGEGESTAPAAQGGPADTGGACVTMPDDSASETDVFCTAGVVSKGNGECFLMPEVHTALTQGGGQAGQGYPCVLAAAFCAGAGASAGGIGYTEEVAPTLKASPSGNMMPSVLCLNDQGGSVMECSEDVTGTLRAQEHGHQPLVFDNHAQDSRFTGPVAVSQTVSAGFGMGGNNQPLIMATQQGGAEIGVGICPAITASAGMSNNNQPVLFENHGIDARYTGPHSVSPTLSARAGTGGNNLPLVEQPTICIAGNIIDRQPENGGNGFGYQEDIAYTLTATDRHSVYSRQRVDVFQENSVSSTESARQHKDATDLVHDTEAENAARLIRRLTPLECERLQGFPDGWTLIPEASDSSRYKALGNSVAIPCVDFVLRGIAYFLHKIKEENTTM